MEQAWAKINTLKFNLRCVWRDFECFRQVCDDVCHGAQSILYWVWETCPFCAGKSRWFLSRRNRLRQKKFQLAEGGSANWNFCAISIFDLIASKELADPIGRSEFRFEAEEGFFFRIGAKERDHFGTERRQAMLGPTEDGFRDLLEKTDSMVDQKTQSPCAV